jgi:hypothetical protein
VSDADRNGHDGEVPNPELLAIDRDGPHELIVSELPCGCTRVHCTWGHTLQQILDGLDKGLTVDDLLCDEHRETPES